MLEILIILATLFIYWFFLIYINRVAQDFIQNIAKHPELYKKAGAPSDTYFFWEFIRLDYKFAFFLWKNKKIPTSLKFSPDKYNFIRSLAVCALCLEVLRGVLIIFILIFHQIIWPA